MSLRDADSPVGVVIALWDCANGAAFVDRDGNQVSVWNVGRSQRDTDRRWRYGNAWGGPEQLVPALALEDLVPLGVDRLTGGMCRN